MDTKLWNIVLIGHYCLYSSGTLIYLSKLRREFGDDDCEANNFVIKSAKLEFNFSSPTLQESLIYLFTAEKYEIMFGSLTKSIL